MRRSVPTDDNIFVSNGSLNPPTASFPATQDSLGLAPLSGAPPDQKRIFSLTSQRGVPLQNSSLEVRFASSEPCSLPSFVTTPSFPFVTHSSIDSFPLPTRSLPQGSHHEPGPFLDNHSRGSLPTPTSAQCRCNAEAVSGAVQHPGGSYSHHVGHQYDPDRVTSTPNSCRYLPTTIHSTQSFGDSSAVHAPTSTPTNHTTNTSPGLQQRTDDAPAAQADAPSSQESGSFQCSPGQPVTWESFLHSLPDRHDASDEDFADTPPALPVQTKSPQDRTTFGEPKRHAVDVMKEFGTMIRMAQGGGYPVGPIRGCQTFKELKQHVKQLTIDTTTMGGGFGVRVGRPRHSKQRGTVVELCCSSFEKLGCRFLMAYECTFDGWVLNRIQPTHAVGCLKHSQPEVMAHCSGRQIPTPYLEWGQVAAEAGFSAAAVHRLLLAKSRRDGIAHPSFDYNTVYDKFLRQSNADKELDVTGLLEALAVRRVQLGLQYFNDSDKDGCITRLFVECRFGRHTWGTKRKQHFLKNVLIFDPTFGTNCYKMKFSMFVTVDEEGASRVIAYMVHREETYADIFWGFRCFHKVFLHAPSTLITDSGPGLLKAAEKMTSGSMPWYLTKHHLCTYHMDQNFYEHLRPLFAGDTEKWHLIHNLFWKLAKDSNITLRGEIMQERFAGMRTYIQTHGKGASKSKALKWFDDILQVRHQKWTAAYTWASFAAGCHASSRGESMNGTVKHWLLKNSLLIQLDAKLDQYIQFKEFKDACNLQVRLTQQVSQLVTRFPPWLDVLRESISQHAWQLAIGQLGQIMGYSVCTVPSDDARSDTVRNEPLGTNVLVKAHRTDVDIPMVHESADGRTKKGQGANVDYGFHDSAHVYWVHAGICECQYANTFGMECRHSMAARVKDPSFHRPFDQCVAERWKKRAECDLATEVCHDEDEPDVTDCFAAARFVMDEHGFQPMTSAVPVDMDIKSFAGEHILIKYGRVDQGGWHIAELVDNGEDEEMELVFRFGATVEHAEWYCDTSLMVQMPWHYSQQYKSRSWLLIEAKQPTQRFDSKNPKRGAPGRPQERRKKPAFGPMS